MGYQNGERPKKKKLLLTDVQFDLTDLHEDIRRGVPREDLMKSVEFIKKTLSKYKND